MRLLSLLLLLSLGPVAWAEEKIATITGITEDGQFYTIDYFGEKVEFLALREGICRSIWVQNDKVISSEIIECPKEELEGYLK